MRGIILGMFLFIWWGVGVSQKKEEWSSIVRQEIVSSESEDPFYLVEDELVNLKRNNPDIEVIRTIDRHHHIVSGSVNVSASRIWSIHDDWKLNLSKKQSKLFHIVTSPGFKLESNKAYEVVAAYPDRNTFLIRSSLEDVKISLLPNPDVFHITNKVFTPKVESRVLDLNLNPNRVNKIHHFFPDLDGSSELVSIQENNFDVSDIDLLNRSVPSGLESEITDNHATEMATVIAGAGNSFVTGRGVAGKVKISSSDFFDAMPDSDQTYIDLGILTQNHSYGIPRENEYGVQARAFDQSAFSNKKLLHIFSSGNEGLEGSSDGVYAGIDGYANLTGNIKMTKNSIVVGSVDTVGRVPAFVSKGPAYDGRVKPEVVAYSVVGSSNSAALVSGVSVLLQQQYREDNAGDDIPSALVKALLINSAEDVGPEGLDYMTGYGGINAWKSLRGLIANQYFQGSVSNEGTETFNIVLPDNAKNLKVTLVWTDPAANVNDFPALVNNLDLKLVDGSMNTTLPWVLDRSPSATALGKKAVRGVDDLNNVEQVTISNPTVSYSVEVVGTSVIGSQDFYLAWQFDTEDSFEWDFPTGSDNMPYNGETGSYFRWSTTKSGTGELSYSDDDLNWTVLDSDVELEKGYWRWNTPPNINNEVKARMVIGSDIYETDLFAVSEPLKPKVGFNCGDSLMLRWDHSANAVNYTIFNLGEEVLEEVATVSDTFLVLHNVGSHESRRFSIQPNLLSGKELLPTPTFDYAFQGVECYVFSFFQTVVLDTGIYLNLTLGTTAGIEEVIFERNDVTSYVQIESIKNPKLDFYSFLDNSPNQGYNEHQVTLKFINGEELTLSAGASFYLTEIPLRIFPNPVLAGESLSIITREFEDRTPVLELIDDRGAMVYRELLQGTQDDIPTIGLRSGIYFYRLIADGEMYTGRILLR